MTYFFDDDEARAERLAMDRAEEEYHERRYLEKLVLSEI